MNTGRRRFIPAIAALLLASAATAAAEDWSVQLSNAEQWDLHYLVVPAATAQTHEHDALLAEKAREFFGSDSPEVEFLRLAPGEVGRVEGLGEGAYLLVGFFAAADAAGFPVRVMDLRAGDGVEERSYTVHAAPAVIRVSPGTGRLREYSVVATSGGEAEVAPAEGGADEEVIREPRTFYRELAGAVRVLPIEASVFWGEGGLRVESFRIVRGPLRVCYAFTTSAAMKPEHSLFLYFHDPSRGAEANQVTLELVPAGYAVLWRSDREEPALVGRLSQTGREILGCIGYADVPQDVYGLFSGGARFDLTSVRHDAGTGMYEEFYVTTLDTGDLPHTQDAGSILLR